MDLPPDPRATSDAAFFHDAIVRIKAALDVDDTDEVARLLDYIRREGGDQLVALAQQAITTADRIQEAFRTGRALDGPMGINAVGQRICDFCGSTATVAFFAATEFFLTTGPGTWSSGDRWYVDARCRELIEREDWRGLRDWVGPSAQMEAMRMMWMGFRRNRIGPAVEFAPGADPETDPP